LALVDIAPEMAGVSSALMSKPKRVNRALLSDLLDLHSMGENVSWPPGYSVDIAREELGCEVVSCPPKAGMSPVVSTVIPTPVRSGVPASPLQLAPKQIQIYTDGSCPNNVGSAAKQGAAGWGFVVLRDQEELDFYGPVVFDRGNPLFLGCDCGTNNTGELSAIGMALRWLVEADLSRVPCTIFYDSKYAANIAQGVWKAEKNTDLARTVQGFFRTAKTARRIDFEHVKGHSGNKWNDRADKNADRGAAGDLQCWPRPATAMYKPQTTILNMFGKRPSPRTEDSCKGAKKARQNVSGLTVIEP